MNMDHVTGEILEGEVELVPSGRALALAQEIDVAVTTAKRFPRRKDKDIAVRIMDRAVLTKEIAYECIYAMPRDGKTITGPSVRFAEIVRSCYGNVRVASRFVRIDNDDKMRQAVIVEAIAIDVEMNDTASTQIRRSIMTSAKGGQIPRVYSVDMIATTVQAAMSIAERNAILKLVPKAVWLDGWRKVEEVSAGTEATLADRRTKMLDAFKRLGVDREALFASLGVESEAEIGLNDMPKLTGMWTALRDGEAVESVLGMAAAPKPKPVANPMANEDPTRQTSDSSGAGAPAGASGDEASSTAATRSSEAQEKPAEKKTRSKAKVTKDAPAATAEAEGEMSPALKEALAYVEAYDGPAGGLLDWWRSKDQLVMRGALSFSETAILGNAYNTKFNGLRDK